MRKNIVLLFFTLTLTITICEILLRILGIGNLQKTNTEPVKGWIRIPEEVWTEYHPELGWFHQKNKHAVLRKGKTLEVAITTNEHGFRGTRHYATNRLPDTKRILMLGDSFFFGWGVQDHETVSAQMEFKYQNLEAINLSVAGYGIDQFLLAFRQIGKEFKPDFIFIGVYQEDFWRATRAFTDAGYAKPFFRLSKTGELMLKNVPVPNRYQLDSNQFPDVLEVNALEALLSKSFIYRSIQKMVMRFARDIGLIDPDLSSEWQIGRSILRTLVREIRETGAEPVLVMIPPKDWMNSTKPTSLQKSMRRLAEKGNVDFIDLTLTFIEAVEKSTLTTYYIDDDWHWSAKGNQLVSDSLIQYLNEKGYL